MEQAEHISAGTAPHVGHERPRPTLRQLAASSLYLGCIGFGGGISVLSNIHQLAVNKRGWLTEREFTNTATVAQMLPGGAAANALAYMGQRFHGLKGSIACYVGFILPGMLAVLALAWAYVAFGATPHAESLLSGVNAAVVGILAAITLRMVRTGIGRLWQMAVAAGALVLSMAGGASSGEVAFLGISAGLAVDLFGLERARRDRLRRRVRKGKPPAPVGLPDEGGALPKATASDPSRSSTVRASAWVTFAAAAVSMFAAWRGSFGDLVRVAAVFFRTGLGAYGGGFAIIPHLQTAMQLHGWLTPRQFADAVAIGKLTPGPVLLLATFIGYLRHGLAGALVASAAIFSGPFALVVILAGWLDRVRSRRWVRAALRGLTPAVVGLMAAAALTLGSTLNGGIEAAIAGSVGLAMVRFELNPAAMLALSGVVRILVQVFLHV